MFTVHDLDAGTYSRHRKLEKAVEQETRIWRKAAKEGRPGKTQVFHNRKEVKEGHPQHTQYLHLHLTEPWKLKRNREKALCRREHQQDRATCGGCGRSWCDRCDPAPGPLCPYCHGPGYSTHPMN